MTTGLRETVLGIINRVERKLNVVPSASLTSTKMTRELLDMLNETIDEISDAGNWQEYFRTVLVTAQSSVALYEVAVSGNVKNVQEIIYGSAVAPLQWADMQDLRQLNRIGNYGEPRQVAIEGVNASSGNPNFRVAPIPAAAQTGAFEILYFQKPGLYGTGDAAQVVVFPSNLVMQGLYAKALLKESGGAPTNEYSIAYSEFIRMRREVNNRLNADVSRDIYFRPG